MASKDNTPKKPKQRANPPTPKGGSAKKSPAKSPAKQPSAVTPKESPQSSPAARPSRISPFKPRDRAPSPNKGKKKPAKHNIVFNKGYFASCVEKTHTSHEIHCYDVGLTDVDVKNFFLFLEKYFFGDSTEEIKEENTGDNNIVVKEPFSPVKAAALPATGGSNLDPLPIKPRVTIKNLNLFNNKIGDVGVETILKFCLDNYVCVQNFKLFGNQIGDAGVDSFVKFLEKTNYPPFEIHLSHNRLSTASAENLLMSLHHSTKYPLPFMGKKVPLWLRLEHNFISSEDCLHYLNKESCSYCLIENKDGLCTNRSCRREAKIHLVYLNFQYYHPILSKIRRNMLNSSAPANNTNKDDELTGKLSSLSLNTPNKANQPQAKKESPLMIFLDTNVIIRMLKTSTGFSFQNILLRHAQKKLVCNPGNFKDSVYFVITDTVVSELDGLTKRGVVQPGALDAVISRGSHAGLIILLGAFQGEKLLEWFGTRTVSNSNIKSNSENDRVIIDIALNWSQAIGEPGSVVLLTDDKNARMVALAEKLPAISWVDLQSKISTLPVETNWSASYLRSVLAEVGGPMLSNLMNEVSSGLGFGVSPMKKHRVLADELARLEQLVKSLDTDQKKEKDEALTLIKSIKGFFENRFEKSIPQQLKQAMLPDSSENEILAAEITEEMTVESTTSVTSAEISTPLSPANANTPGSAEKKKKKKKKGVKKPKDQKTETGLETPKEHNGDLNPAVETVKTHEENINNNKKKTTATVTEVKVEEKVKTEVKIEVVAPIVVAKKETTPTDAAPVTNSEKPQAEKQ